MRIASLRNNLTHLIVMDDGATYERSTNTGEWFRFEGHTGYVVSKAEEIEELNMALNEYIESM